MPLIESSVSSLDLLSPALQALRLMDPARPPKVWERRTSNCSSEARLKLSHMQCLGRPHLPPPCPVVHAAP